jgi:hypothetical protein
MSAHAFQMRETPAQNESADEAAPNVSLTPGLDPPDALAAYWIAQVTLRLRREIGWCWHQRAGADDPGTGVPPPLSDAAQESLDLTRYEADKRRFFENDVTARWLSARIDAQDPPASDGAWQRAVAQAKLDAASQFVLALALTARIDASCGPVFAACHNDANRAYPTLALAQRLWDSPLEVVACADPSHALFRFGLIAPPAESAYGGAWQQPLEVPAAVARTLLDPGASLAPMLEPIEPSTSDDASALPFTLPRSPHMQLVPLVGRRGADFAGYAAALAGADSGVVRLADDFSAQRGALIAVATTCWLRGLDVVLPEHWLDAHTHEADAWFAGLLPIPVRWFAPCAAPGAYKSVPAFALGPALSVTPLDYRQRVERFIRALPADANALRAAIAEAAKRFRCEEKTISAIAAALGGERAVTPEALFEACRATVSHDLDHLAQRVKPRFALGDLVLPPEQTKQLEEAVQAMRALGAVHYEWGTAAAWNESGLSVLFCGPPGTGKTMAAEALATELDLPMYRVDLSQVVNKYIGETEKNLKRIFDTVEASDCVLLFDEADALFGKRTEVKDAHDRFANIEVSYLLERMERFQGLAVLATNRRKDLDDAFLRRLRYIVEFPLPGVPERERIWRNVFPRAVDVTEIDFAYLARAFQLAGGHIRSIAFNACLLAAGAEDAPRVRMRHVLIAVKRELDKLKRPANRETFGAYADAIAEYLA